MTASVPSNNDYFYPGSIVKCINCYDLEIQGEVITFDRNTGALVLKKPASSGSATMNNISVVNTHFVKHIEMIKESDSSIPTLPALSGSKLRDRHKKEVQQKMTLANARSAGLSDDGINLFIHLQKAFPVKSVNVRGEDILVMDDVVVKSPYQLENCVPIDPEHPNIQGLNQVKKVVERYRNEQKSKSQGSS